MDVDAILARDLTGKVPSNVRHFLEPGERAVILIPGFPSSIIATDRRVLVSPRGRETRPTVYPYAALTGIDGSFEVIGRRYVALSGPDLNSQPGMMELGRTPNATLVQVWRLGKARVAAAELNALIKTMQPATLANDRQPDERDEQLAAPLVTVPGLKRDVVRDAARRAGLAGWAGAVARQAAPSIRLRASSDTGDLLGSRLGGQPMLPNAYPWPEWKGNPMSFIAQVRLSELPSAASLLGLPPAGLLAFFYDAEQSTWGFDPGDRRSTEVAWFPTSDELALRPFPDGLAREARFGSRRLESTLEWTLPPWWSEEWRLIGLPPAEKGPEAVDLGAQYEKTEDELLGDNAGALRHRMLGFPDQIQNEMRTEREYVARGHYTGRPGYRDVPDHAEIEANAINWKLLLQVDSEEQIGMAWGDVGRIYYWIRADALAKQAFEEAWLTLQCY